MERLEYGNLIALPCKIARAGKSRRARTDYCDPVTVALRLYNSFICVFIMIIGNKPLKPSYSNRLEFYAKRTFAFALAFLRTNSAAYRRQRRSPVYYLISALKVALLYSRYKIGNVYIDGTPVNAGVILAVKTAFCFLNGYFSGIAEGYLVKIMCANIRLLCRHLMFFGFYCHIPILPSTLNSR